MRRAFTSLLSAVIASAAGCAAPGAGSTVPSTAGTGKDDLIRLVVLAHGRHPQASAWYQVLVTLLDEKGNSVFPDGGYTIKLTPAEGEDGRAPVLDGIVWERFDGNSFALTTDNRLREDVENRGRASQRDWKEWRTLLKLPREELGEYLPQGAPDVRVTVEFRHAKSKVQAIPAGFTIPVRDSNSGEDAAAVRPIRTSNGIRPPQTPVRRLTAERGSAGSGGAYQEWYVTLFGAGGEQTLPPGELRFSVAPRRDGEAEGPTDPAVFAPLPLLEPPTRLGRRLRDPERLEFRQRVMVDPVRAAKSVPAGTTEMWLRVDFVPLVGEPPPPAIIRTALLGA
jgi:hypothetical protein